MFCKLNLAFFLEDLNYYWILKLEYRPTINQSNYLSDRLVSQ